MQDLVKIHTEAIEANIPLEERFGYKKDMSKKAAFKSAHITAVIAVEFAIWLKNSPYEYPDNKVSGRELFAEFLEQTS